MSAAKPRKRSQSQRERALSDPEPHSVQGNIATVGVLIHARHYRDAVVAAFRGARDLLVVDLGDVWPTTLPPAAHRSPDAILLDLPQVSLCELVEQLSLAIPRSQLIAMNRLETEEELLPLFEAGITGFVPHDASAEDIVATVRVVLRGEFRCPQKIVAALARRLREANQRPLSTALTPRQAQIAQLIEQGLTNKQIATRLGIEFSTVKNHVHRLLKKFGVHKRQHAVGSPPPPDDC